MIMEPVLWALVSDSGSYPLVNPSQLSDDECLALICGGSIQLNGETLRFFKEVTIDEIKAMPHVLTVPVPMGAAALVWPGNPDSNEIEN